MNTTKLTLFSLISKGIALKILTLLFLVCNIQDKYLDRFKGIDFIDEFYNVEHTQSFDDVIDDLALLCRKNGGALA